MLISFHVNRSSAVALALTITVAGCAPFAPQFELHGPVPSPDSGHAFDAALFQTVGARLSPGHRWKLEDNGAVFEGMVEEIGRARLSVDIVTYIWHSGQPSEKLLAALSKRSAGVACRILTDPLGSPDFADKVEPQLRAMGCETHLFRPLWSHPLPERNHRKIAVIDGRVGFVGGFGVRKEWVKSSGSSDPEWRDINLRLRGPAVAELQRAFAQNWQEAGGALLPPADFPTLEPDGDARAAVVSSTFGNVTNADRLTLLMIASAKKRLWIWNAYFVPDDVLKKMLLQKRQQGVDVRFIVPGDKNDVTASKIGQRRSYPPFLQAGVRIWEYGPSMMHAKVMLVDERLALIGSVNLDDLSLTRLEEDAVLIEDRALVEALEQDWQADVAKSHEVTPDRR